MSIDRCCDPELVFDLADGALTPEREREARAHLASCPVCKAAYEREVALSARLRDLEPLEAGCPSVCREVAMALPTRSRSVRLLWSVLAGFVLLASLGVWVTSDASPALAILGVLGSLWGLVSGGFDGMRTLAVLAGPVLLAALAVGAVLDLALAAFVLSLSRRRAREA
ncbi:MAG: zf-HC2 domain-containing protein [Actinomycetota bacterium]